MSKQVVKTNKVLVVNKIFTIRGMQVMADADLADMYQVELKRLNEQVKRNINRFPESFRFQLTKDELELLKSQFAISRSSSNLKSQFATSTGHGGRRTMPHVYTEQGVAMLSAVLRSDTAVKTSIAIMNAFVEMRKTLADHQQLLQLSQDFTAHKLDTDQKFKKLFDALGHEQLSDQQGIFFNGQTYDAYDFINKLIKKAKTSIMVVDNYIDDTVITQLCKKRKDVAVYLFTKKISKQLNLDIEKVNTQYSTFSAIPFLSSHDRFLVIDEKEVYHIGASLKDLGKKWFAFSKMDANSVVILKALKELI